MFEKGLIRQGTQAAYLTLTAAVALTPPNDQTTHLILQPHTQGIWYTIDGTTPTAAAPAWFLAANDSDIIPLPDGLDAVRVIEAAASASISYQWASDRGI